MNLKSFSTKLFILLTAVVAFAFDGDDNPIEFYLSSNRIYAPGDDGIAVEFSGRVEPRSTVKLTAYRIEDPVGFFLTQTNPHSPGTDASEEEGGEKAKNPIDTRDTKRFTKMTSWDYRLTSRDKYWQYESIPVPLKEKGVYLIEASTGGKSATTALVITELGMIVKQSNSEVMAFVVKRKTGERVTGLPLTFARGPKLAVRGQTGSDGVATASMKSLPADKSDDAGWEGWGGSNQILAVGAKDGNFVISDSYFYSYYGNGTDNMQVYLHTDRPVYRPSQTVYYRGIVRRVTDDGTYENVTGDTASIEVTDARGGSIKKDRRPISDMGTFNGELELGDEPPLGNYTINVSIGGASHSFTFEVQEYKKPEYEVTVKTDKEQYTRGDVIKATVNANYYFGSPVAEGEVQYSVFRTRYWRPWWWRSGWAYLYEGSDEFAGMRGMQMISSGSGKLNPDGTFAITYQTDRDGDDDYVYRIQANVVDASRRSIAGSASVRVTRGEFYITAQTTRYVYKPGDEARVNIETMAFDGDKPISAPYDVKVERTWWEDRGKRGGDNRKSETVWQGSGTTDNNGTGSATFTIGKAGYYVITVTGKDGRGTKIATTASIYVTDGSYANWYYGEGGDVQIIPDKDLYKPGETMSALVIMPSGGLDALVTVEGATIYSHQVEHLGSTSAIVRIPIEARFAPAVYLSASTIAGENFYNATKRIAVVPQGKILTLEVKTDREVYKPGAKGTVTVRALDDKGEPVGNTDIALAMVDEALYAIHPDDTPDIQKFFYGNRYNQVSTTTSLNFGFYARARRMVARDGLAGGAAQEMAMSKAAPPAAPMMAFMDESAGLVEPTVRTDFRDLMYWTPSVRTDGSGRATIDVTFPDNLTTWRITARGVNRATAVGQTTASVIARKDLLVRMETPRFITQGDELVIATTVHNYLSSEKRTTVRFAAEGVELADREKVVSIPANGEQRIDWRIKAPKIGSAKLTVKALTNEESDAMELTVPILPLGVRSGASALADMDESTASKALTLTIPANSDPATGELSIALAPSAASSILGALDDLIGYPYGCVEQTMSRFLPTAVVADALKKIDVPFDPAKREELPKMVAKGLGRLYGLQHDDGGWGWWEHDETNPFMTAYVMYGMTVAKRAGYDVDANDYDRGLAALRGLIESRKSGGGMGNDDKKLDPTTEAYMLYVASYIAQGSPDALYTGRIGTLARRDDINNYGQALLALAARYQNDNATASRLADRLTANAQTTGSSATWSGKSWHYNWQDDQVETSAFAVKAILEIKGETDLVRKGIHFLLSQKKGDAWENTRQTAMVIYALVDYIKGSHELDPNYNLVVRVNGREVFNRRMTKADIFAPEQQVKVSREMLKAGDNVVTIEKSGSGRLYASARLSYFATGSAIRQADAGFKVERTYYALRRERKGKEYIYSKQPYTGTVKSGDEILVKVKITPSTSYEYFLLEDPLPAGCEVVLNTDGYAIDGENGYGGRPTDYYRIGIWNWWYADRDVRDEKVAFFARSISPQTYEFTYIMRAQIPGTYAVMPAVGMLMYYPEVRGNSNTLAMNITD